MYFDHVGNPWGIERRDPASGVMTLGTLLGRALRLGESGEMEIRDGNRIHGIELTHGAISGLSADGKRLDWDGRELGRLGRWVEQFFYLPRPHVFFYPALAQKRSPLIIPTEPVLFKGVTRRRDLFNPVELTDRIPVETLWIDPAKEAKLPRRSGR